MDQANLLQLFIEQLPDHAIFLLDIDGKILSWNEGARNLLGYQPSEVIGREYASLFSPDAAGVGRPAALLLSAREGRQQDEGQHRHRNGSLLETNCVLLPLKDAEGTLYGFGCAMQERSADGMGTGQNSVVPLRRETILVVDDDEQVRAVSVGQLERLGYNVLQAANGPEALQVLDANSSVDMLFTDVVMPGGMNGGALAREARRLRPELKVLFTSGDVAEALLRDGRLEPGFALLVKPYGRHELSRKVREVLRAPA